jgi:hypothetical protein
MIGHKWVKVDNPTWEPDSESQRWRCLKCGKGTMIHKINGDKKPDRYDVVEYLDGSKSLTCEEQIVANTMKS